MKNIEFVDRLFQYCMATGVGLFVESHPGQGKTSRFEAMTKAIGRVPQVLIASIHQPPDFAGWPVPNTEAGYVSMLPTETFAQAATTPNMVIIMDEFSNSAPSVQAACLRPILERVAGNLPLHPSTNFVLIANPAESAADGNDIVAPLANRVAHAKYEADLDTWCEGVLTGFTTPAIVPNLDKWREYLPQAKARIVGFIRKKPQNLTMYPKDQAGWSRAYPTPRSCDLAARLLAAHIASGSSDSPYRYLEAMVGMAWAAEFEQYDSNIDLPNPKDLLDGKIKWAKPERGDIAYTILAGVVGTAASDPTKENLTKLGNVLVDAMKTEGGAFKDIVGSLITPVIKMSQDLKQTLPLALTAVLVRMTGTKV